MKLFAYSLREYDELGFLEDCAKERGFEFGWTSDYPTLDNVGLCKGYDCLSIITNPMTPRLLDAYHAQGIKSIATRSIGFEHIDVEHARSLGMRVAHAAYPPEGVANYAIMLMMMAMRKVKLIERAQAYQEFGLKGKIGKDISSATVGVIGTGKIGATVVRHLSGFGCKILACDPYEKDEVRKCATYVSLDELLTSSDVITLHAPGSAENHHMIDANAISRMKRGVVIVNAARGSLIDTDALVSGLESGQVGAAALDTIENEAGLYYLDRSRDILPNRDRAVLDALPNCIVLPHMAFYTATDVRHMVESNVDALMAFDRGEDSALEVK
ncbi:MAG: D-isomer specific 2-hydroxyacid dehydrogenase family protein [Tractidigestivibacter sp.]|jgi:lactate dehydrogenase-like 2-hydroxyacid dehydrogenase|uniref:D-isomer specific 2-hydroxyacid dehydrogenase family protein n=1 Tax=Tractidigestivibacter sp. TaxID=2847320 RepID=UPI003D91B937